MNNLIRSHIYLLRKDKFFYGCLAISLISLAMSIRYSLPGPESEPITGLESLMSTFLGGDLILYAFMLLTANMVSEAYHSGAMKTIIGRGIGKKKFCLSIIVTISVVYLLVMLVSGMVMGGLAYSRYGMGALLYVGYYALSVIARILFVMTHISFALVMTIITRNAIMGLIFGLAIPNVPQILEMIFSFFRVNIELNVLKISTHMPSIDAASNDLSQFLVCFVVLICYLVIATAAAFWIFKRQDIK